MSFSQMSDTTKAMLFMFLGLLVAIMLLGYHKSPLASPSTGAAEKNSALSSMSVSSTPANINENITGKVKGGFY